MNPDPDPAILAIDLQAANKKLIFFFKFFRFLLFECWVFWRTFAWFTLVWAAAGLR